MSHAREVKRPARRTKRSATSAHTPSAPAMAPAAAPAAPAADRSPTLPPELHLRGAAAIAASLRDAVAAGGERIDASHVAVVDTAGVQLLIAAGRLAAAHGRALRWQNPSGALLDAATRLGVVGLLGLAEAG